MARDGEEIWETAMKFEQHDATTPSTHVFKKIKGFVFDFLTP